MSAHRVLAEIGQAALHQKINDPGDEGVMDLAGKSFGVLTIESAGTRLLPESAAAGTTIIVANTSGAQVAVQDSASAVGANVADNGVGIFVATGDTTSATAWVAVSGSALS